MEQSDRAAGDKQARKRRIKGSGEEMEKDSERRETKKGRMEGGREGGADGWTDG